MTEVFQVPLAGRFWDSVDRRGPDDCWIWNGSPARGGYGQLSRTVPGMRKKQHYRAHRFAWMLAHNRPIPPGLVVMHLCDNRRCVNPAHLQLGTTTDNNRDMVAKGRFRNSQSARTHCPRGHPYISDNIIREPGNRRRCRICKMAYDRRRKRADYHLARGGAEG